MKGAMNLLDSDAIRIRPAVRWLARALAVIFILNAVWICPAFAASDSSRTAVVKTENLNLRSSPSTSSTVLAELPLNAKLSIISTEDDWYKVKYESLTGYVKDRHVTVASSVKASTETQKSSAPVTTPPNRKRTDITLKPGDISEDVLDVQEALRRKGYFKNALSTEYGHYTQKAVELFQKKSGLSATGIADPKTLKTLYGKRTDLPAKVYDYSELYEINEPSEGTNSTDGKPTGEVEATLVNSDVKLVDWWSNEVQKVLTRGKVATITDMQTGLSFKVSRYGGSNHADMEPLTREDTAIMKRIRGGEWGWSARAVYITVDGQVFAAAMNGQPHGAMNIADNGFEGHFCLHFLNSRTHRTNRENPDMQDRIMEAFEAAGER